MKHAISSRGVVYLVSYMISYFETCTMTDEKLEASLDFWSLKKAHMA
jgi:hypothetical protein